MGRNVGRNLLVLVLTIGVCIVAGLWGERRAAAPSTPAAPMVAANTGAEAGPPLPDFRFTPWGDSASRASASLKGRAVLINFWASWCVPCVAEFPVLLKLVAREQGRLVLLAVSVDHDPAAMQRFLETVTRDNPNLFPSPSVIIVPDPQRALAQDLFQTVRYPETILVDSNLRMQGKIAGADADWLGDAVRTSIEALLSTGAPAPTPSDPR